MPAFRQAADAGELRRLVSEYDNVFGMPFYAQPVLAAFPDAPQVSYVELLRALRLNADARVGRYRVEVENFESIHNHSAYAVIERA